MSLTKEQVYERRKEELDKIRAEYFKWQQLVREYLEETANRKRNQEQRQTDPL